MRTNLAKVLGLLLMQATSVAVAQNYTIDWENIGFIREV